MSIFLNENPCLVNATNPASPGLDEAVKMGSWEKVMNSQKKFVFVCLPACNPAYKDDLATVHKLVQHVDIEVPALLSDYPAFKSRYVEMSDYQQLIPGLHFFSPQAFKYYLLR